jgi:hypothetical protein
VSDDLLLASAGSEDAIREELYQKTRAELLGQQSSNTEAYDKAVITISAAFLGVSLAFMKDYKISEIYHPVVLVSSWVAFALAIVACVASFLFGNSAIEKQLALAYCYYKEKNESALSIPRIVKINDYVNRVSGSFLILGVILTITFVSTNLMERISMSKIEKSGVTIAADSQLVNRLQAVEFKKSATVNAMQKVPAAPAPAAPAPASSSSDTQAVPASTGEARK